MALKIVVGDLVWVQTGQNIEENGTVLKLDCARNKIEESGGSDDESSSTTLHDGIMVKLIISNFRGIYAPDTVRAFDVSETQQKSTRSSAKTPTVTSHGKRRPARCSVTPSPQNELTEVENKEDKKPAAKRKRSTAEDSSKATLPAKKAPVKKQPAKAKKTSVPSKSDCDEGYTAKANSQGSSPYFSKESESKVSVASLPSSSAEDAAAAKKPTKTAASKKSSGMPPAASKKGKGTAVAAVIAVESNHNESEAESEEEEDRPFTAEYSKSGRATCRRCDQVITKGALRISHVPLFRGKPGFRVYRHLNCALFSEEILQAEDIGGWKKLTDEDYEALSLRIEASRDEIEKENEEIRPDELVPVSFQGEIRSSAPGLTANLLPFQVEGASWMYCQEVNMPETRGGILADEMGMGKTVQTLATMLDNKPKLQHSRPGAKHPPSSPNLDALKREEELWKESLDAWNLEMEMNNVPKKLRPKMMGGARAGTLVICPVVALSQWKSEIEKFTELDALTVGIYHGPNRTKDMPSEMMQKYDVVLTTYQVLEQDFRKMVSPNKVSCPNCGAKYKVDKLTVHLKYFCGEGAQRTEAQARQRRRIDRPGGGGGKKGKISKQKKRPLTKVAPHTETVSKRKVSVKSTNEYESESELSAESGVIETSSKGRSPRKAAEAASKLLSSSVKEWALMNGEQTDVNDSSSLASDNKDESVGSHESSEDDDKLSNLAKKRGKGGTGTKKKKAALGRKRSARDIAISDDEGVNRAVEKQRLALVNTKQPKKVPKGKAKPKARKKKFARKKKGEGKTFDSDSDESSNSSDDKPDPLAGIDMDKLLKKAMAGSRFSPLHSFSWWRIVLDEAHFIKSRSSQTAASAFALSGIHRWCLSGTPLQNRVGELYSLIRFLRLEPMAHYFCRLKGCGCKSIHYRMVSGKCLDCKHGTFSHFSHFNKYVLNPIQRDGYTGDGRRAMFTLKTEVLDRSLLRRTKESRAEDMNLPPRIVTIRTVRLHPIEQDFYDALYTQTRSSFDDYVAEGTLLNNYAHIFDLLTKMRQAVNHPYLIVYSKKNMEKRLEQGEQVNQVANGSVDCDICHEPPTERVLSSCCGAGFCRSCVVEYLTGAVGENTPCPSCQAPFSIDLNQASAEDAVDDGTLTIAPPDASNYSSTAAMPSLKEITHVPTGSILRRINLADYATSSKIEVLITELIEMRQKRPGSKALVFSQFVNMLDLIRWRIHSDPCLSKMGMGVRILHGGMNVKSKDETLKDFREDNSVRVLLMSLKSGGVALNLTVASEVYLVDAWWNPAAEMQAIDRTHRLGQYRPIRAVRLVAEGTVEERVVQLQEKKRLVFDGTVGRDAGSLKMLNVNDMKALFA